MINPIVTATSMDDKFRTARAIVAGLTDAAVLLDRGLEVVEYNEGYVQASGLRRKPLDRILASGVGPFEILGTESIDAKSQAEQCLEDGSARRFDEIVVRGHSTEPFTGIVTYLPVFDTSGDTPIALIVTTRDVSGEARLQGRYKELLALERARAEELERQVTLRTQELAMALEEVIRLSNTDPLTKLMNRRAFNEAAGAMLAEAKREECYASVLMIDLDHFKKLNDTYGHHAGDKVLTATADVLLSAVGDLGVVGRYGGEEFVVVSKSKELQPLQDQAQACHASIHGVDLNACAPAASGHPTASVGFSCFPEHGDTLELLMKRADDALYRAKRNGRDQVATFSTDMENETVPVPESAPVVDASHKPRVLWAGPRDKINELQPLRDQYDVATVHDAASLHEGLKRPVDAVVCHDRLPDDTSGIDALVESLDLAPDAVRILVIHTTDLYMAVRGTNKGRVDYFLLAEEEIGHLQAALEDSLIRKELDRRRLLAQHRAQPSAILTAHLDSVLDDERLDIRVQPILDAGSERIYGYEAFSRPQSEGLTDPRALFEEAVRQGKIWELSRLVRRKLANLYPTLPDDSVLFVNLHPADLDDPELASPHGMTTAWADRIVFEIAERASIPDFQRCRDNMVRLRKVGYRFAIDDLGAGYASLNSVAMLEPDFIKIDMALTRDIELESPRAKLIRRVIQFARDANIQVVAEGIESEDEASALVDLGCDLLQGYFFGKPTQNF